MSKQAHLVVESGPLKGRTVSVGEEGIRIGRSSRNDLSIDDSALSRFHCRLFLKPEKGLWISDLGSANGTVVNGTEIQEHGLVQNDVITLGKTTMRVTGDQEIPVSGPGSVDSGVNLGLGPATEPGANVRPLRRWLFFVLGAVAVLVAVIWGGRLIEELLKKPAVSPPVVQPVEKLPDFEMSFERVEGTASNIFRYAMVVVDNRLVVQVDDLITDRHIRREKQVASELLQELSHAIQNLGFFDLLESYEGVAPGIHESSEIRITVRSRTHCTRVLNHVEPEVFAQVRVQLEEFSKNEMGLAALAIEPAELIKHAHQSLLLGQKLYDEREVAGGNLAGAVRALTEAEWYLETIEPKPQFYGEVLELRSDCQKELQQRYENIWFVAERAVKLRDWREAAKQLRTVCEMIPDRSDDRNRNAYKKLVDVERRLSMDK
jgi:hypothetical protein